MFTNRNGLQLEWTGIEIGNENQNKLFTLTVKIGIQINCIPINMFALL